MLSDTWIQGPLGITEVPAPAHSLGTSALGPGTFHWEEWEASWKRWHLGRTLKPKWISAVGLGGLWRGEGLMPGQPVLAPQL